MNEQISGVTFTAASNQCDSPKAVLKPVEENKQLEKGCVVAREPQALAA